MPSVRLALFFTSLLLSPALAAAQSDEELAKQYFRLGEELYNRADYEGAFKQFQQAYELSKKPPLLYNMARCQESLGQHQRAIDLLTEYMKSAPENRDMIEARMANLRRLVERNRQEQPRPQPTTPASVPPAPAVAPASSLPATAPPSGHAPPTASRPLRLPGWIGVGVGGALLISGIALGATAKAKASDLEEANRTGQEFSPAAEDRQRTFRNAAIGTLVAGGVVAVVGAVLLVLDARSSATEPRSAWIAPSVGPYGAGLAGQLSF